jgi:formate hydrogenlyase subunit 6/NADH:ubiquinone oxidoreductase subunit I
VNCHYCEIICPEFAIFSVEDPGITDVGQAGTNPILL